MIEHMIGEPLEYGACIKCGDEISIDYICNCQKCPECCKVCKSVEDKVLGYGIGKIGRRKTIDEKKTNDRRT